MRVYRVQDKDGRGPWKPGFSLNWVETRPDHDNLIPEYVEFPGVLERAKSTEFVGCGCKTIEQLRRWFSESEYQKLQGYGYHAVVLKPTRILASSEIQCLFTRLLPLNEKVKPITLY